MSDRNRRSGHINLEIVQIVDLVLSNLYLFTVRWDGRSYFISVFLDFYTMSIPCN